MFPDGSQGLPSARAMRSPHYDVKGGVGFAHSSDGVTFAAVDGPVPEELKGDACGYTYLGSRARRARRCLQRGTGSWP